MLLEAFYEKRRDELVAALSSYSGDREAAADAVQEAFLRALNNRALLSGMQEKTLWSWLYATAKNALIDEKRKASRTRQYDNVDEFDLVDDLADGLVDTILVGELMHKLPANLFPIISLRYFGGLNATEIGALKGIPPATVRSQIRSALSIMKKHMKSSNLY
ncbi:MAG: sigma-70 family RNA polymerase sigma factor [Clostridiales bacterium]|nr:sigma-70 family RNA polymerase sigma factor [Clostridiales bacterium]